MMQYPTEYPQGGGTVGAANAVYGQQGGRPAQEQKPLIDQNTADMLVKGLKSYMNKPPASTGSAPISAPAGQQSISALSNAPTVQAGTPAASSFAAPVASPTATADLGGGAGGGMGVGGYAGAAAAMAALIKGGNKLNIGASNQAKWYRRAISDSNEKHLERLGQALKFWKWG